MYTESTYTGIALITPMNALTFCDVLYQISSSDEPDAMYTFATGMQLVLSYLANSRRSGKLNFRRVRENTDYRPPYRCEGESEADWQKGRPKKYTS